MPTKKQLLEQIEKLKEVNTILRDDVRDLGRECRNELDRREKLQTQIDLLKNRERQLLIRIIEHHMARASHRKDSHEERTWYSPACLEQGGDYSVNPRSF